MTSLALLRPHTEVLHPRAQGLRPCALGIYVVISHFTFKKVSRIPHYYNSQSPGSKDVRRLAPLCPCAQGLRSRAQGLHPRALAIYAVISHFTFKKVSRIPHTTILNPQESKDVRRLAPLHPRLAPTCPRLAPSRPRHLCCHLSFYIQKGV